MSYTIFDFEIVEIRILCNLKSYSYEAYLYYSNIVYLFFFLGMRAQTHAPARTCRISSGRQFFFNG
jgi:hypothetical protein